MSKSLIWQAAEISVNMVGNISPRPGLDTPSLQIKGLSESTSPRVGFYRCSRAVGPLSIREPRAHVSPSQGHAAPSNLLTSGLNMQDPGSREPNPGQ
jgi:hypothetical protein